MSDNRPIARLANMAGTSRRQISDAIAVMVGTNRDARALFLNDDGVLKPEAERLFGRLAREANLKSTQYDPDANHLYYMQGKRDLVLFMARMLHLDVRRLQDLQTRMEQSK